MTWLRKAQLGLVGLLCVSWSVKATPCEFLTLLAGHDNCSALLRVLSPLDDARAPRRAEVLLDAIQAAGFSVTNVVARPGGGLFRDQG